MGQKLFEITLAKQQIRRKYHVEILLRFPPQKELSFSDTESEQWLFPLETLYFSLRNDCEVITVTTSLNVQCVGLGHYLSLKNTICFLSKFSKFVMCAELHSFRLKLKAIIFNVSVSEKT